MQIGNSNDRFYFQVCISLDIMINKLAMKIFGSRGQDNKKHRMNKKHSVGGRKKTTLNSKLKAITTKNTLRGKAHQLSKLSTLTILQNLPKKNIPKEEKANVIKLPG